MTTTWLLWGDGLIALAALFGVVRLGRAQTRHRRETHIKVASLARLIVAGRTRLSSPAVRTAPRLNGLSQREVRALNELKRRSDFDPAERIINGREKSKEVE